METKVLSAIMSLQGAQIMLSNYGIHTALTTNCVKHGSIDLTAFTHNATEDKIVSEYLSAYEPVGFKMEHHKHDQGKETEFDTFTLMAYMTDLKD